MYKLFWLSQVYKEGTTVIFHIISAQQVLDNVFLSLKSFLLL